MESTNFLKKFKKIALILFASLFYLCTITPVKAFPIFQPYLGILGGVGFTNIDKQTYTTGLSQNDYDPKDNTNKTYLFGLNGGIHIPITQTVDLFTGLGFYKTGNYNPEGKILQTIGSLTIHRINYEYKLSSMRLMLEGKLGYKLINVMPFSPSSHLMPFISLGIGAANNKTSSYKEIPAFNHHHGYPCTLGTFGSKTETHLAYQAGLGLDYLAGNNSIGLTYQYVDLGKASFAPKGNMHPHKLPLGDITTSELLLSFIHIF